MTKDTTPGVRPEVKFSPAGEAAVGQGLEQIKALYLQWARENSRSFTELPSPDEYFEKISPELRAFFARRLAGLTQVNSHEVVARINQRREAEPFSLDIFPLTQWIDGENRLVARLRDGRSYDESGRDAEGLPQETLHLDISSDDTFKALYARKQRYLAGRQSFTAWPVWTTGRVALCEINSGVQLPTIPKPDSAYAFFPRTLEEDQIVDRSFPDRIQLAGAGVHYSTGSGIDQPTGMLEVLPPWGLEDPNHRLVWRDLAAHGYDLAGYNFIPCGRVVQQPAILLAIGSSPAITL